MKSRIEPSRTSSGEKSRPALLVALAALAVLALVPLLPAATGETIADQVLGQADFVHEVANTVDGASLSAPDFVAIDTTASPNHLYVADTANNRVLGWNNAASFTNGAAADLVIGQLDFFSSRVNLTSSGPPASNTLSNPTGVAVDSNGNLYVADTGNNRVLEYAAPISACKGVFPCVNQGASSVFGQLGDFGASGCNFGGFTITPDADDLCGPNGVALDSHDNLYITDTSNNRVLEYITPLAPSATAGSGDATADLVFGQGASGTAFTVNGSNSGGISGTSLSAPRGVAVDGSDNLYISDTGNNRVLEFDEIANPPANVTAHLVIGQSGLTTSGCGGLNNLSGLCQPFQLALDAANNLFVADRGDNRALGYSTPLSTGMTANLAFRGLASDCVNGPLTASTLCAPQGIAVDSAGDVFVGDTNDNRVTKFNTPLSTDTVGDSVLGQGDFTHHAANSVDADGVWSPTQVAVDRNSTPNRLYLADSNNSRVLGWRDAASFTNGAPADLVLGQPDFFSGAGNNGAATPSATTLSGPAGVAVDSKGNLYVSDMGNNRVLEFNQPFTACAGIFPCVGGAANLVFGQAGFTTSTCPSVSATSLCTPRGLALDGNDDLYVTDSANNRVLEYITPLTSSPTAGSGDTTADLVFGQGASGTAFTANTSNNGGISATSLSGPRGVAADGSNDLYISDTLNNRVLEYDEAANPPVNVTADRVFGQGGVLSTKACGSPTSANTICSPSQVTVDSANNLWVADTSESRVLEFNKPLSTDTTADRVFGQADNLAAATCNFGNIFAPAAATLCGPTGVALDSAGDLLVVDNGNNRVLRYNQPLAATPTPTPSPVATPTPTPGGTPTPISTPTPTPGGTLSVATPELFGSAGIGVAPKVELLAIHNLNPHKTMVVSLGALASPFGVLSGFGPFEIAPLHKTTVKLQFAPTVTGKATGTLDIASTDPHHSSFPVALIGTGVAGHLVVNLAAPLPPAVQPTLGFGAVHRNTVRTKKFTVTNSALGVLNGSVGTFAGGSPFSVTQGGGAFTLQPHKSLTIGVQFAPLAKGKKTDTLVITDTAPGTPASVKVTVSGKGS